MTDLETADLLSTLATHRDFLRGTLRGLTDEQAAATPTVSALCLGGLIKHVASVEAGWARFIVEGAPGLGAQDETGYAEHERASAWSRARRCSPCSTVTRRSPERPRSW